LERIEIITKILVPSKGISPCIIHQFYTMAKVSHIENVIKIYLYENKYIIIVDFFPVLERGN